MVSYPPFCKRKDRRLKFTRPPVLLVDHCELFELLFSQVPSDSTKKNLYSVHES